LSVAELPALAPGYAVVPDVRGLPIRRAINALAAQQLEVGLTGSGVVISQRPAAGQHVEIGTRVAIQCESKTPMLLSVN
jgi:beta-lactam-binding protein with PASTA domain